MAKKHFPFLVLLCVAGFLYLYNHTGSLQPWDEAWYGAITQNMIKSNNPFVLEYNQHPFYDHPPFGFQLKALSMLVLGRSTLAIRLPEIVAGLLALVALYRTGTTVSSKWAGVWAGIILLTSRWFLFRARLGNLDILLVTTQLWTVTALFEMLSKKRRSMRSQTTISLLRNHAWFVLMFFFLSLSILSKALISLQLVPLVTLAGLYYIYTHKLDLKSVTVLILSAVVALIGPLLPWIVANSLVDSTEFIETLKTIGLRSNTTKAIRIEYIQTVVTYTRAAMHTWFKIGAITILISLPLLLIKKHRATFFFLLVYVFLAFAPYLISEKTEIWHLLPGIAALSLLIGVALDVSIAVISKKCQKILSVFLPQISKHITVLLKVGLSLSILTIATLNIKNYWSEFLHVYQYPSDYEKITWHIPYKNKPLYTTTDAYFPGLVFYANLDNQPVLYFSDSEDLQVCQEMIAANTPLQIVSRYGDWVMDRLGDTYLISREGDLVLTVLSPEVCKEYVVTK
ncbi:glycosyltransferase family 39 protein [Candidatus Woesebacteria bacterium]|nr:glycosyltransferase family 39 protein [Candidatus Woesebacteria bacterium]